MAEEGPVSSHDGIVNAVLNRLQQGQGQYCHSSDRKWIWVVSVDLQSIATFDARTALGAQRWLAGQTAAVQTAESFPDYPASHQDGHHVI